MPLGGTGIAPAPQIVAETDTLAFGEVQVGQSLALPVWIGNTGTGTLSVTDLVLDQLDGAGFALGALPILPATVMSGDELPITVQYMPTQAGAVSGTFRIQSNDINMAELPVAISGMAVLNPVPQIVVEARELRFGDVGINQTRLLNVTIRNPGTRNLEISDLLLTADVGLDFALSGGPDGNGPVFPFAIVPGGDTTVTVAYHPTVAGLRTGDLRVIHNVVGRPEVVVKLSGTGVEIPVPQITADAAAVVFGEVAVGTTQTLTVRLGNPGSGDLTILGMTLESDVPSSFTLSNAPRFPLTVVAGGEVTVDVSYSPTVEGTATSLFRVESNAANEGEFAVPISGTGVALSISSVAVESSKAGLTKVKSESISQ